MDFGDGLLMTFPLFKDGQEQVYVANEIKERLSSYDNWSGIKTPEDLAIAGFRYTGVGDTVQCDACGLRLHRWRSTDDPTEEHRRYSSGCSFIRRWFMPQSHLSSGSQTQICLDPPPPIYPQFKEYQQRLASFHKWPYGYPHQSPSNMARAGLFFHKAPDRVKCFQCGLGLRDWENTDYPMSCHEEWSPDCPFIKSIKTQIQQVDQPFPKDPTKVENTTEIHAFAKPASSATAVTTTETSTAAISTVDADISAIRALDNKLSNTFSVDKATSDCHSPDIDWNSPIVRATMEMGCSSDLIQKAISMQRGETGKGFDNASSLYEAILQLEA